MQRAKKDQRKRQSAPDWQVAVEYEAYLRCPQDDWVSTPARLLQIYMEALMRVMHSVQMVSMAPYSLKIVPLK